MKKLPAALGIFALAAIVPGVAQAEVCYKLNPFIDVIRLSVLVSPESLSVKHQMLYGNWIATGAYTLPVTGARELKSGGGGRRVGLVGTNTSTIAWGGNLICGVDGIPGGAWKAQCSGNATDDNFQVSGTPFSVVSCGSLPTSAPAGKAAGSSK